METARTLGALRRQVGEWRRNGRTVALVPTMGNLHRGHLSLVDAAMAHCDRTVCSIYVNPTQFGPTEDFGEYPRTLSADLEALRQRRVALAFCPADDVMYPGGADGSTYVEVPNLSDVLCGAVRPGHFRGVTTVVCRLLNMVLPDRAVFGEKDYQQLVIIRRMVKDLSMPVEIVGCATQRESDGLALSSRNQYLQPGERQLAPLLYAELCGVREAIVSGERDFPSLERRATEKLQRLGFRADYVAIRHAETLGLPGDTDGTESLVVLGAAWLGRTRLIDNVLTGRR